MKYIKQIAFILLLTLTSQAVFAQIHESKSFIRKTTITDNNTWKKCQGFVRAGVLIPVNVSDECDITSPTAGFDLDLGFKLRMGSNGWYWGMDIAFFTTGIKHDEFTTAVSSANHYYFEPEYVDSKSASGIGGRLGVSTFGWRARFSDFILDINAGIAAAIKSPIDYNDAFYISRERMFRVEVPIGIGLAYKHISIDLSMIVVPIPFYSYGYTIYQPTNSKPEGRWGDLFYNNFRISLGYLF